MTSVYLIRHGTTDGNQGNRFQGRVDHPLNALGLNQGEYLARRFETVPLDAVYCSPLTRTRQTAAFVCRGVNAGLTPIIRQDLIEVDGGDLEDQPQGRYEGKYPGILEILLSRPSEFVAPGGETSRQVYDRFKDQMAEIVAENPDRTIAVVTHGFALMTYLNYVKEIPFPEMKRFLVGNMSVTTITYEAPDRPALVSLDDQSHLPEEYRFRRIPDPRDTQGPL